MPALYPVSVAAEDFKVGDNVKWFTSSTDISPYVGKVVAVSPKTYKVWVTWPVGETQQHAPEELILVPKYQGMSVVQEDNGYDSYDKQKSAETFGTMSPSTREKMASAVASRFEGMMAVHAAQQDFKVNVASISNDHVLKMADLMMSRAASLKEEGKNQMQAYAAMYDQFGTSVSDDLVKQAVIQEYEKNQE